jgi:hypothetical protein
MKAQRRPGPPLIARAIDSGLQPVGKVTGNLGAQAHRALAGSLVERHRAVDRPAGGSLAAADLDQRHQMRRIEGVAEDDALGMRRFALELARRQRRRARRDDDVGRKVRVDIGHQVGLDRRVLGAAFLHEGGAGERLGQRRVAAQPLRCRAGREAELGHDRPDPRDEAGDAAGEAVGRVPGADVVAARQEPRRPGGADRAGADDRDCLRAVLRHDVSPANNDDNRCGKT